MRMPATIIATGFIAIIDSALEPLGTPASFLAELGELIGEC